MQPSNDASELGPLLIDDLPNEFPDRRWWLIVQRVVAACMVIALLPLFLLIILGIKLESRGSAVFCQSRRGMADRPFTIFKFRTMRRGSEKSTALGTTARSSQVTRIGRILRATKLDELPQLWNVARGDMQFVGPRPLPIGLDDELRRNIVGFGLRTRVRPGLTNIAQISVADNRLGDALIGDWTTRFDAELQYIRRQSVRLDMLLICMTAVFVLRQLITRRRGIVKKPGAVLSINVLGVPIACMNYDGVCTQIGAWIRDAQHRYIGVCPVHNIIEAVLHPEHRAVLRGAGLNTPDGMPIVWAKRLMGDRHASRVYGPTLMLHLLELAQAKGWRVAFYGGLQECLDLLIYRMQWRYPALNLVSTISPPFGATAQQEEACIASLRDSAPQLVFVGLGCPKQERWMARNVGSVPGVMIGVGAAFDFHAGTVQQAPGWMQRIGLEWLFRVWREPRRLAGRYASTNPIYIVAITLQWMSHVLLRRNYVVWHAALQESKS